MTVASTLAIAWFTLRPDEGGLPAVTGNQYLLTDLVLNVLLFLPLGIGLALSGLRVRTILAIGMLSSAAIELAQLWWISGRTASLHDVVTNGMGAAFGAMLVAGWSQRARWRSALGIPLGATLVALWVIGGLLVVPRQPPGGNPWFGFWAHEFAGTTLFPGRVLDLSVQGLSLPDGPIPNTELLRARLSESDTIRLTATLTTGGHFEGRAQLVGVGSGEGEELLSLWQTGHSILARQRLRMSDLSVRTLWFRMDGVMPTTSGDTISVVFEATRRALDLTLSGGGSTQHGKLRLGPEMFWTGFLPFEYEAGGPPWWPLAGAGTIFLVLGFFVAPNRVAAIAALAVTLLIGPGIGSTAFPSLATILTAIAGTAAGWFLARKSG